MLGLGLIGLAAALTIAAFAAPNRAAAARATYRPSEAGAVVARVPLRDPREIADRAALAAAPDRVELAVELARTDIARARASSDPRYLGRAQATLARWWKLVEPPPEVLLLRATIEQSLHDFGAARSDLDRLIRVRPDAQAYLTRAVVSTVTGDYAAARESCDALVGRAQDLVAIACRAPLDGLSGRPDEAYRELARAMATARRVDPALRGWGLSTLAELAIQRGDDAAASDHLRLALALDPDDAYARAGLADVLVEQREFAAASQLLAGRETIDNLLVRRAIAEHLARGPEAAALADKMRERIAAAAERGDRVHLREEAMFVLVVEGDAPRALAIATENWSVQKELADARLLVAAAAAAHRPEAAKPVLVWATATGVRDARLDREIAKLGASEMRRLARASVGQR